MRSLLWRVIKEEEGATALEYAILVVLIAIVLSFGAVIFGNAMQDLFSKTGSSVNAMAPGNIATP